METERALHRAEASADIARAVGGETDVGRVLDLIVKRARALVEARTVLVLLRRRERLVVTAQAGQVGPEVEALTIPADDAVFRAAMQERVAQHLGSATPPSEARLRERLGAEVALVVPLLYRGRAVGVLVALDREGAAADFDEEDLTLLQAFAASAAIAVATAQSVEAERLQQQVESAEAERRRWAQELHDGVLQSLAAMRITLAAALQGSGEGRAERIERAGEGAVEGLEDQIGELSRLINDLRPAALERLGLHGALEALAEESANRGGFEVETEIAVDGELSSDEERGTYRLVQEALNNVVKHAGARHASIDVKSNAGDGRDRGPRRRFRLRRGGTRPRPRAAGDEGAGRDAGGTIEVDSRPGGGTTVRSSFPLRSFLIGSAVAGFDHLVGDREADQLGTRLDPDLLEQFRPVDLDRTHAEEELLADLAVGVAEGDEPQ